MGERDFDGAGQSDQCADLINAILKDLFLAAFEFAAAKVLAVGEAGMGPGTDTVFPGEKQRGPSFGRPAGMKSARHVGRGNERHQLGVRSAAFAQNAIQVEVERHQGTPHSRTVSLGFGRHSATPRSAGNHQAIPGCSEYTSRPTNRSPRPSATTRTRHSLAAPTENGCSPAIRHSRKYG